VGVVYKGWGAERKLHLAYRTWDNSEKSQQNMHELEKHPKTRNEMVHILQKMKQACQPLSTCIVQPIFKGTI